MKTLTDVQWQGGDFVLDAGGNPALVTGTDVVRQDLHARLRCPPGAHWAYLNQGVDLLQYIQGAADPLSLLAFRQDVEIGCEQDTRIWRADAEVRRTDLRTAQVQVVATLIDGSAVQLATTIGGLT